MNESDYIYCERCGSPMKKDARYCMKCGNLNYNHPDNQKMKNYAPNEQKTYQVGSGKITPNTAFTANSSEYATNTGNKKLFLIINILWFLLTYGGSLLLGFLHIINFGVVALIFITLSLFNIYFISLEIINMKANKPWWGAIIPIYNNLLLAEIAFGKMIYVIFYFIPIVNFIFILITFYQLGKKFNKNPILTMLFNILMLPIIAFGASTYMGVNYIDLKDKNAVEKEFKIRKRLLYCILLFFVLGFGGLIYFNMEHVDTLVGSANDKLFVENAKSVVKKVKRKVNDGSFNCLEETSLKPNSTHYFVFTNIEDELSIPSFDNKIATAYVKIFNNNGVLEYSISMTNGEKGIYEVKEEELNNVTLNLDYKELNTVPRENECFLE